MTSIDPTSTFPTTVDTFPTVAAGDATNTVGEEHWLLHNKHSNAIIATQQKVQTIVNSGAAAWGAITGTLSAQTDLGTALGLKAPLASPTFTGTVTIPTGASITAPIGLVRGDVGLGNVDNTSNATERAATATLTNKTLTSPVLSSPTGLVAADIPTLAESKITNLVSDLAAKAPLASPTFTGTVTIPTGASITAPLGIVKADVGLGNVDNVADASKAFAGSQITSGTVAIARIPTGTTASTVPLGGVITGATTGDASHSLTATYNNAGQLTAVTANSIAIAESQVTNLTTDLAAKAPLASPTFTGTVVLPAATVTLAMQVNAAANSIRGNNTGSATVPLDLTVAQTKTLLNYVAADIPTLAPVASPTFTGLVTVGRATSADGTVSAFSTAITSASAAFTAADVGRPIIGPGIQAGTTISAVTNGTTATLSGISISAQTVATWYIGGATGGLVSSPNVLLTDRPATNVDNVAATGSLGVRAYGGRVNFSLSRSDGTPAAGTPVLNAEQLGSYQFGGATTSAANPTIGLGALITATATENWDSTHGGTSLIFQVHPNGNAGAATALTIDQDRSGTFTGALAIAGALTGVVALTATGLVTLGSTGQLTVSTSGNLATSGSALSSSATGGVGYATGAGGAVTQLTSKATAFPTISKTCGTLTWNAAALASDTTVTTASSTNTAIAATDTVVFTHISGGTLGAYNMTCTPAAGTWTLTLRNLHSGSLSEAPVFAFAIIKAVTA